MSAASVKRRPKRVGKYVLGDVLGEGSYGLVREGYDVEKQRVVAVKCVKRRLLTQRRHEDEIVRQEIEVLQNLPKHPHLVEYVDYLDDAALKSVYLATEHISGVTLVHILEKMDEKRWRPNGTLRAIFRQVLEAVQALHEAGIAHRDIAPDNVIISPELHVKLVDFGNAVLIDRCEDSTKKVAGTLLFQAPEVANKTPGMDLYQADVWSIGVMLFVCVYGRMPYVAESLMKTVQSVKRGEIQWPSSSLSGRRRRPRPPRSAEEHDGAGDGGGGDGNDDTTHGEGKDGDDEDEDEDDPATRKFLEGLLEKDPKLRMTVRDVLTSEWLNTVDPVDADDVDMPAIPTRTETVTSILHNFV